MCTEAAATVAEIAAGLWNCPGCDTDGFCFGGDVDHPDDLPIFQTLVCGGFADCSDKVPACLGSLWGVLVGALFIGLLPQISASVPLIGSSHGQDVVFGLIVILMMLLLPTGFVGLLRRLQGLLPAIKSDSRTS